MQRDDKGMIDDKAVNDTWIHKLSIIHLKTAIVVNP